ncbi:MAG: hypothetical protein ACLPHI_10890 [Terriglobales bacterium]
MCLATLGLMLIALPVWAQRRGGGGGGSHAVSHGAPGAGHYSGSVHSGSYGYGGGYSHGNGGVRIVVGSPYYGGYYGRRGLYPYGYSPYSYYGWYGDPFFYDTQDNGDQDSYSGASNQPPYYPAPENSGLQRDVQALSGKIDRLQADVEARNRPKAEEPETALVFRDQHIEEVRNYAIAGGTLWVLNERAAKKIPLAQLDLPATIKMNDDRGVDFQVPQ